MSETPVDPRQIAPLPEEPIDRLAAPVRRFLHVEAAGGAVLLGAAAVALVLANSAWSDAFLSIWKTPVQTQLNSICFSPLRISIEVPMTQPKCILK